MFADTGRLGIRAFQRAESPVYDRLRYVLAADVRGLKTPFCRRRFRFQSAYAVQVESRDTNVTQLGRDAAETRAREREVYN